MRWKKNCLAEGSHQQTRGERQVTSGPWVKDEEEERAGAGRGRERGEWVEAGVLHGEGEGDGEGAAWAYRTTCTHGGGRGRGGGRVPHKPRIPQATGWGGNNERLGSKKDDVGATFAEVK